MWYVLGEGVALRRPEEEEESQLRWGNMLHVGNRSIDVQGCIAPGIFYEPAGWVGHSGRALTQLNNWLFREDVHRLRVRRV